MIELPRESDIKGEISDEIIVFSIISEEIPDDKR